MKEEEGTKIFNNVGKVTTVIYCKDVHTFVWTT
jgi:hypothetical protein